ncbi:MAG: hypothetical protein K2Q14_07400 [Gammaproteobacteria bacterium]|nr:hypothetical protein [Gammaproteobacteria bacterium]
MQHIERKFRNTNQFLINELQKLDKECDGLIDFYSVKNVRHYEHQIKLGAIRVFKCVLDMQMKSLTELQQAIFSRSEYCAKFKTTHQQVTRLAGKILSKETQAEREQHYGSFNQHLKCINNILLPYSRVDSSEKVTLQGRHYLFFTRKTTIEKVADDVLFKMQRASMPSLMAGVNG